MSTPFRTLQRGLLGVALVLVALVILIGAYDHLVAEGPTWEPVEGATALDGWQPPWDEPSSPEPGCRELPDRWLMVDWDAADWGIILPLLEAGELPNLEQLLRRGAYGNLASFQPSISPAIWTTVATGLPPDEHGIKHFYNRQSRLERWWTRLRNFGDARRTLYSNADRRAPAVWNLLSERNEAVMVVGYHNTFPAEEVEGMVVSNYLTQDSVAELMQMDIQAEVDSGSFAGSLVYPPEHLEEVLEIQRAADRAMPRDVRTLADLDSDRELRRFLESARELDLEGDQRPYFLSRAWLYDEVVARVAERFYPEIDPTLAIVHFQSLDWAAHHFLYFDRPERYERFDWSEEILAELDAQMPLYTDTVAAFYRNADDWLGRLLDMIDERTGVLLLSDHGSRPGPDPDLPGYHDDAPPGIVVLAGPGIRRGQRIEEATIYDILPTLMAGIGAPVAEDLPGRVLEEAFCQAAWSIGRPATIASYSGDERFAPPISRPEALDEDLMKQLESLGYLD